MDDENVIYGEHIAIEKTPLGTLIYDTIFDKGRVRVSLKEDAEFLRDIMIEYINHLENRPKKKSRKK